MDLRPVAVFRVAVLICGFLSLPLLAEENWPQWRGPLANGVSPDAEPPLKWSGTENVRWKVKLPGRGTSTPVVWGNQVFIQTAIPTGKPGTASGPAPDAPPQGMRGMSSPRPTELYQFVLMCIDRQTGKTLWQQVAREETPHEGHHRDHGFASYSPVTDGNLVFAFFGSRGLHCYDMQGNRKWEKDFGRLQIKMSFGEGNSPALFGDALIINWDHEGDDFVAAFDKTTGKELWRQKREEGTSWSTPLVVEHEGRMQVIIAATAKIRSYDLKTGEPIWECAGMTANVIPTPVAGHGMVFVTSGFRGNALLAIKLGRKGDLTGTDAIAWSLQRNTPYVPSPLLYGDKLYIFSGNNGILSCHNAITGEALIDTQRVADLEGVYASPVGAANRVYLVGRNGTTVVIPNTGKYEVLATNVLDEGIDASPAMVGKDLLLRGREHLYCFSNP